MKQQKNSNPYMGYSCRVLLSSHKRMYNFNFSNTILFTVHSYRAISQLHSSKTLSQCDANNWKICLDSLNKMDANGTMLHSRLIEKRPRSLTFLIHHTLDRFFFPVPHPICITLFIFIRIQWNHWAGVAKIGAEIPHIVLIRRNSVFDSLEIT